MDWQVLQSKIKGRVVVPSSPEFNATCNSMVWNKIKPDRIPEVIVQVKNEHDVSEAVKFAATNALKVVVHGGGHTWCGLAVRNGGMTIDLSELNQSTINKASESAIIQPVISNRELARRLGEQDLAFPVGHCPTVKASGYLLNGGMSWNMGHWGPACFSIDAIDFVTAKGNIIKASREEHPDLFWAARGCGPGMFAIAVRYYLKCYPLPKAILSSNYYYSLDNLKDVVKEVSDLGWQMPDNVELSVFLIKAPKELEQRCKHHNGKLCMVTAVVFADTEKEGKNALKILGNGKHTKDCLAKTINVPQNFDKLAETSGITWPENHRNLCENQCSKANPDAIVEALKNKIVDAPSPKSVIVFCLSTGGRPLLEPREDVALSMDGTSYGGIWSIWEKEEDDQANYKWHNECTDILKKFTSAHYIGETDIVQDNSRVKKSYSPEKWKKMEQIRQKYDPDSVFFGFEMQ